MMIPNGDFETSTSEWNAPPTSRFAAALRSHMRELLIEKAALARADCIAETALGITYATRWPRWWWRRRARQHFAAAARCAAAAAILDATLIRLHEASGPVRASHTL